MEWIFLKKTPALTLFVLLTTEMKKKVILWIKCTEVFCETDLKALLVTH